MTARAPRRWVDPGMSANCRAQHGMPHSAQEARCTSCSGCPCHSVRPPADFRARVEQARAAKDAQDGTR